MNWRAKHVYKKNFFTINFGPQHPAAHGVLRLVLQVDNEYITKVDMHIGLLHRGTEYLIQNKPYILNLGYFDRLDYVSMLSQEHAYAVSIENLCTFTNTHFYTLYIRVLFDELTRVLNHLLAISCHALDLGSMSALFWAFEERENILEFYERISGARMHANLYKPNDNINITRGILFDILEFIPRCYKTIQELSNILVNNKIWKSRLVGIGKYGIDAVKMYSLSGVLSRCVGFKKDIRINNPYATYSLIDFSSYVAYNGDSYDRFILRLMEMSESLHIVSVAANWLLQNNIKFYNNKKYSMASLILEFKKWMIGDTFKTSESFVFIESPKGDFSVQIYSLDNYNKPVRCKIRSSSLHHLNLLNYITINHGLADLITIVGTIDIVFGEVDR